MKKGYQIHRSPGQVRGKGRKFARRYPDAHARYSVQRAVGTVASSSFRVLFRK